MASVIIYGKDNCPYTAEARRDYERRGVDVEYINVKCDAAALERMMALTSGDRRVPVIVDAGRVTVGFGGT